MTRATAYSCVLVAGALGCAPADKPAANNGVRKPVAASPLLVPVVGPFAAHDRVRLQATTRKYLDEVVVRASELAGGDLSVTALHVESGERYAFGGARGAFLAETMKLPLVVQLLARVDRREIRLSDTVSIERADLRPSSLNPMSIDIPGGIGAGWRTTNSPGSPFDNRLTVADLLKRAITRGDATAIDALLRVSGGPARVQSELRALGIRGIRVDRSYADYVWDFLGADPRPPRAAWSIRAFDSVAQSIPRDLRDEAALRFHADVRDRATSDGMATLLARIAGGELLSDSSRALLVELDRRSQGSSRWLADGVPYDRMYLRFGAQWGGWRNLGTANEVTLVLLPNGGGHLALAVMASNTTSDSVRAAVANVGRRVYEAFATPTTRVR